MGECEREGGRLAVSLSRISTPTLSFDVRRVDDAANDRDAAFAVAPKIRRILGVCAEANLEAGEVRSLVEGRWNPPTLVLELAGTAVAAPETTLLSPTTSASKAEPPRTIFTQAVPVTPPPLAPTPIEGDEREPPLPLVARSP